MGVKSSEVKRDEKIKEVAGASLCAKMSGVRLKKKSSELELLLTQIHGYMTSSCTLRKHICSRSPAPTVSQFQHSQGSQLHHIFQTANGDNAMFVSIFFVF